MNQENVNGAEKSAHVCTFSEEDEAVRQETLKHIANVRNLMLQMCNYIVNRALVHDQSKLREPENSIFIKYTPRLKDMTYGSDEYKKCLEEMKPALDHHYSHNRHHPEFHEAGIRGMCLQDLVEMLCDWFAAGLRHKDGDIYRSIEINQKRFGYSDELADILRNTAEDLMAWHKFKDGAGIQDMLK